MKRLQNLPVPILPAFVGTLTLSNIYAGLGYGLIRHLMMWTAAVVLICYTVKIIRYPGICKKEYETVVPCSLYAGFAMLMMILGSYFFEFSPAFGKGLWATGLTLHALHIAIFTVRNLILKRDIQTFVPSWYVTYNGIMVSCVVGGSMQADGILKVVVYYGIVIYFILTLFIVWRLLNFEIKPQFYHTMAILIAPCSLCVVSCINVIPKVNPILPVLLYLCVLTSLSFIVIKLPKFFSFLFSPGYAGLTFPMAIGTLASVKMSDYLANAGYDTVAAIVRQISGLQLFLATMIIGYVLLRFLMMLLKIEVKEV